VVTLKAPSLSAFGRTLVSARPSQYGHALTAAQNRVMSSVRDAIPAARIGWRYRIVVDGFSVLLPKKDVPRLARVTGVAEVWPSVTYRAMVNASPETINADKLWGVGLATSGQGLKIGIIDDGIDVAHRYFDPAGYSYPPGFPKGQKRFTSPKVIVARAFPPPGNTYANAALPFDPESRSTAPSPDRRRRPRRRRRLLRSPASPRRVPWRNRALTVPTPEFGLDGNSAEQTAAIEASPPTYGRDQPRWQPEIEPSRDIVVQVILPPPRRVPVVAAGNDFGATASARPLARARPARYGRRPT
jgi:hypothetical protein